MESQKFFPYVEGERIEVYLDNLSTPKKRRKREGGRIPKKKKKATIRSGFPHDAEAMKYVLFWSRANSEGMGGGGLHTRGGRKRTIKERGGNTVGAALVCMQKSGTRNRGGRHLRRRIC